MFILYDHDSNFIHVEPMTNHNDSTLGPRAKSGGTGGVGTGTGVSGGCDAGEDVDELVEGSTLADARGGRDRRWVQLPAR